MNGNQARAAESIKPAGLVQTSGPQLLSYFHNQKRGGITSVVGVVYIDIDYTCLGTNPL